MRGAYFHDLAIQSLTRFVSLSRSRPGCNFFLTSYRRTTNAEAKIKFVNTSMHGVGHPFVQKAFESFGFPPFVPVEEQMIPDPDFPTVKFPNPEETGLFLLSYIRA